MVILDPVAASVDDPSVEPFGSEAPPLEDLAVPGEGMPAEGLTPARAPTRARRARTKVTAPKDAGGID